MERSPRTGEASVAYKASQSLGHGALAGFSGGLPSARLSRSPGSNARPVRLTSPSSSPKLQPRDVETGQVDGVGRGPLIFSTTARGNDGERLPRASYWRGHLPQRQRSPVNLAGGLSQHRSVELSVPSELSTPQQNWRSIGALPSHRRLATDFNPSPRDTIAATASLGSSAPALPRNSVWRQASSPSVSVPWTPLPGSNPQVPMRSSLCNKVQQDGVALHSKVEEQASPSNAGSIETRTTAASLSNTSPTLGPSVPPVAAFGPLSQRGTRSKLTLSPPRQTSRPVHQVAGSPRCHDGSGVFTQTCETTSLAAEFAQIEALRQTADHQQDDADTSIQQRTDSPSRKPCMMKDTEILVSSGPGTPLMNHQSFYESSLSVFEPEPSTSTLPMLQVGLQQDEEDIPCPSDTEIASISRVFATALFTEEEGAADFPISSHAEFELQKLAGLPASPLRLSSKCPPGGLTARLPRYDSEVSGNRREEILHKFKESAKVQFDKCTLLGCDLDKYLAQRAGKSFQRPRTSATTT